MKMIVSSCWRGVGKHCCLPSPKSISKQSLWHPITRSSNGSVANGSMNTLHTVAGSTHRTRMHTLLQIDALKFPRNLLSSQKLSLRLFSTQSSTVTTNSSSNASKNVMTMKKPVVGPTVTRPLLITSPDGTKHVMFDLRPHPPLKPSIVQRRLKRCRTYPGRERDIRHSPWRLNLIAQFAAGLPVQEALTQLEFCRKSRAALVQKVIKRTANVAHMRDGLCQSQLEVAECFATKGTPLKRNIPMGRGRTGQMTRPHAHLRVVLREIDFELKQVQAKTLNQKKKWFSLQQAAEQDAAQSRSDREERQRLEQQAKAAAAAKQKTKK
jgi:large subunit ribosomal protein L22